MSEEPTPPLPPIPTGETVLPAQPWNVGHRSGGGNVARPGAPAVPDTDGWQAGQPAMPGRTPRYRIRVRAVFCADTDGAHAATVTPIHVEQMLTLASQIYAAAGLSFALVETDTVKDTVLNQDVTITPTTDLTTVADPSKQYWWSKSFVEHNLARDDYARAHRGRLVVFFRRGTSVKWDDAAKVWVPGAASKAFSGSNGEFVAMGQGDADGRRFAHESGHYFHLNHTHTDLITLTDPEKAQYPNWQTSQADRDGGAAILKDRLAKAILKYVDKDGHPADEGLQVLDGDGLADTAPDPAPPIFRYVYGDACAPGPVTVDVPLATGSRPYTVSAPLDLTMSYFYACPGPKRFTPLQIDIIRRSLETEVFTTTVLNEINQTVPVLSRNHLIRPTGPGTVGDPSDSPRIRKPPQTRPPRTRPIPDPASWLGRLRAVFSRR